MSQLSNEYVECLLGNFLFWFGLLVCLILTTLAKKH